MDVPPRACGIEKPALQLRWDRIPLHHDGRAEAPQNMLLLLRKENVAEALVLRNGFLLFRKEGVTGIFGVGNVQCLLVVFREPFRVVSKLGEPLLELLIFALFVVIGRLIPHLR